MHHLRCPLYESSDASAHWKQERAGIIFRETLERVTIDSLRIKRGRAGLTPPQPCSRPSPQVGVAVFKQIERISARATVVAVALDAPPANHAERPPRDKPNHPGRAGRVPWGAGEPGPRR